MNESTKLEALVKSAMEKVRELSEAETIIGKQIVTADGTTIIPVSKVSFGLASGGTDIGSDKKGFGGGSGAGVNTVPEVVDKIIDFIDKKTEPKQDEE